MEKWINLPSHSLIPTGLVVMKVAVPENDIIEIPREILVKGWDEFPHNRLTKNYDTKFLDESKPYDGKDSEQPEVAITADACSL